MKTLANAALLHDFIWAIEPKSGASLEAQLRGINAAHHRIDVESGALEPVSASTLGAAPDTKPYDMVGKAAIISIVGPMTKGGNSFSMSGSTVGARRLIRQAAADPDVKSIVLRLDSPGGAFAGTMDLAEEITRARNAKTVVAYAEDLCCSAAYWVACACESIYANDGAVVGSIGTYMVVEDSSRMADQMGVTVHVISSGPLKGAGVEGAEVTDDQRAAWQVLIDDITAKFLAAVKSGRGLDLTPGEMPADGDSWIASKAEALGLIDGVVSLDDLLALMNTLPEKKRAPVRTLNDFDGPVAGVSLTGTTLQAACDEALTASTQASEAILIAQTRAAKVLTLRASQDRAFSAERLDQLRDLETVTAELAGRARTLRESCEALGPDPAASDAATTREPGPEDPRLARLRAARDSARKTLAS